MNKKYHTTFANHIDFRADRFYKGTLFASAHMLVGIDCLSPGQAQMPHMHAGHDKMYYIQQGQGIFTVADETIIANQGDIVWAPADTMHHVVNTLDEPLIMLITMAPEPR
ncbi:MAG: cupin domain-containing protein [Chloroflexia bacterium]|nr:cupin domain-containing protein [Chloroflexia bacterium]